MRDRRLWVFTFSRAPVRVSSASLPHTGGRGLAPGAGVHADIAHALQVEECPRLWLQEGHQGQEVGEACGLYAEGDGFGDKHTT